MPATQRGQVDRIKPGHWRLRWRDEDGKRHGKQPVQVEVRRLGVVPRQCRAATERRAGGEARADAV